MIQFLLQVGRNLREKTILGLRSHYVFYRLTALEENEGRDAHYLKSFGRTLLRNYMHFKNSEFAVQFRGNFIDNGAESEAGPAPGRPKIDQNGERGIQNFALKACVMYRGGITHGTLLFKFSFYLYYLHLPAYLQ